METEEQWGQRNSGHRGTVGTEEQWGRGTVGTEEQWVAPSLAKVINWSIINSICPAQLKLARVTPIYKQGSKTDLDN